MRLEFKPQAFEDLQYWVQHQPKVAKRLLQIDGEHRWVYQVEGDALVVAQAKGHYD